MASAPPCISCFVVARFLGRVLFNRMPLAASHLLQKGLAAEAVALGYIIYIYIWPLAESPLPGSRNNYRSVAIRGWRHKITNTKNILKKQYLKKWSELSRDVFLTFWYPSQLKHLVVRAFLAGIFPKKLKKHWCFRWEGYEKCTGVRSEQLLL